MTRKHLFWYTGNCLNSCNEIEKEFIQNNHIEYQRYKPRLEKAITSKARANHKKMPKITGNLNPKASNERSYLVDKYIFGDNAALRMMK